MAGKKTKGAPIPLVLAADFATEVERNQWTEETVNAGRLLDKLQNELDRLRRMFQGRPIGPVKSDEECALILRFINDNREKVVKAANDIIVKRNEKRKPASRLERVLNELRDIADPDSNDAIEQIAIQFGMIERGVLQCDASSFLCGISARYFPKLVSPVPCKKVTDVWFSSGRGKKTGGKYKVLANFIADCGGERITPQALRFRMTRSPFLAAFDRRKTKKK